jgi:hypothetical protein
VITAQDFGIKFKAFGFSPEKKHEKKDPYDSNSKPTTHSTWHLPVSHPVLAEFVDMDILRNANAQGDDD